MKILFVCGAYSDNMYASFSANCKGVGLADSANAFQTAIIEGLDNNNADYEVVSVPYLPVYPIRYKRFISPSSDFVFRGKIVGKTLKLLNLVLLNGFSVVIRLYSYLSDWLRQNYNNNEPIIILSYTASCYFMYAISRIKNKYPNVIVCSIIPDLSSIAKRYREGFVKKIQIEIENFLEEKFYRTRVIDKYILLTKPMEEMLPESAKNNIIVEGVSKYVDAPDFNKPESKEKSILYTGALRSFVGICNFVDAFMLTKNPNYRLVICGDGADSDYIRKCASLDLRIIMKGNVSHEEALRLQREATVLVNPRPGTHYVTRYSFPSKTMEYMTSGTPMMGYKLEGIPKEYYEHMFVMESENKEYIAHKIDEVLSKPQIDLNNKAQKAYEFIINNKTAEIQVKRILDFLSRNEK